MIEHRGVHIAPFKARVMYQGEKRDVRDVWFRMKKAGVSFRLRDALVQKVYDRVFFENLPRIKNAKFLSCIHDSTQPDFVEYDEELERLGAENMGAAISVNGEWVKPITLNGRIQYNRTINMIKEMMNA